MSGNIATQFVCHNLSEFATLIDTSPKVVLLAVDFHEDFIDEESITIAPMPSFQSPGVYRYKLDTPKTASRPTVMPRSASGSSISRWLKLKRWYSQTA
jgi:hypothetical protein